MERPDPTFRSFVEYTVWGTKLPLSAFDKSIDISYGTVKLDGSERNKIETIPVRSAKPAESLEAITLDLNGLGEKNINIFLGPKGIVPSFARYLAFVLRKGRIDSVGILARELRARENIEEYNKKPPTITTELVKKQTDIIRKVVNADMTVSIK